MLTHHDWGNLRKKAFNWVSGSRGLESSMVRQRMVGRTADGYLDTKAGDWENWKWCQSFEPSKPTPSDALPPTKTTPLDPLNHSTSWEPSIQTWASGEPFSFKPLWVPPSAGLFFLFPDKGLLLIWMSLNRPGLLAIQLQRSLPSLPLLCWD